MHMFVELKNFSLFNLQNPKLSRLLIMMFTIYDKKSFYISFLAVFSRLFLERSGWLLFLKFLSF